MSSLIQTKQTVAPSAPATNKTKSYINSSGQRVDLNDTGVSNVLNNTKNPNFIRNGGFWFAQRQAPGTLTTYSTTTSRLITADGWGVTNQNASVQYRRTDTVAAAETGLQSQFYGTFTKITNTGKVVVSQMIESRDAVQLRGRTVRVQGWLKADSARVVNIALAYLTTSGTADASPATFISAFGANGVDPTLGTNVSYVAPKTGVLADNATVSTNCVNCNVTTEWQRFGGVFDVPANLKNLYVLVYTDSQLTLATGTISLAQFSLTDGAEIQDWVPLSHQAELDRCLRYYWKTFALDTLPATNIGTATGEFIWLAGKAAAVASQSNRLFYAVPLRANATVVTYNPGAANAQVRDESVGADCTGTGSVNVNEKGIGISFTGNAGTLVGSIMGVHVTADAEMI